MSDATPTRYVRDHGEELVSEALDLLAIDTSNPPGDTREVVSEIESRLAQLPVDVERYAVDPAKPNDDRRHGWRRRWPSSLSLYWNHATILIAGGS
jgi:hypothetical protein